VNLEHPDFQILFDALLYMAKHLLKTQDEFLPIGAIVTPEGELRHVGAKTEEEFPGTHVALHVLEFGLKEMAAEGACRAVGVALDSRLKSGDSKDAVWITLEEIGGKSQGLIVPYAKSAIGDVAFGDATAMLGNPRIFVVDKATRQ
jgi:hypothetical protein